MRAVFIAILFILNVFTCPLNSFAGNIFIEFGKPVREKTKLTITASVTKVGGKTEIYNVYGDKLGYYDQGKIQIYLTYVYIPLNNKVKMPPSDIKIIRAGDSLQMPQPIYSMDSIGRVTEKWIITFDDVPEESGNVIIKAVGIQKVLGDMEKAELARNIKIREALKDKDNRIFDYAEVNPPSHLKLKNRIDSFLQAYVRNNPEAYIKGNIIFHVDEKNKTSVEMNFNDTSEGSFYQCIKKPFNKEKLDSRKLGYEVKSIDNFSVLYVTGNVKAVYSGEGQINLTPAITDSSVYRYLNKSILNRGTYHIKYTYASINDAQVYKLTKFEETRKIGKAGKSVLVVAGLIALVLVIGALL